MTDFLAQVKLDELEVEFKAQIETALAAGLKPTHLDWHALRIARRPEIFDVREILAYARKRKRGIATFLVAPLSPCSKDLYSTKRESRKG